MRCENFVGGLEDVEYPGLIGCLLGSLCDIFCHVAESAHRCTQSVYVYIYDLHRCIRGRRRHKAFAANTLVRF